jgi:hypothetical protein
MRLPEATVAKLAPFVPEQDLRAMRVVTGLPGRWLPSLLRMSAVTLAPLVCFASGKYDVETARGLALIAHEAVHITQGRELGRVAFYLKYLRGQLQSGFRHQNHPMEIPAIALQRAVFAALVVPPNPPGVPEAG